MENKDIDSQTTVVSLIEKKLIDFGVLTKVDKPRNLTKILEDLIPPKDKNDWEYYEYSF